MHTHTQIHNHFELKLISYCTGACLFLLISLVSNLFDVFEIGKLKKVNGTISMNYNKKEKIEYK